MISSDGNIKGLITYHIDGEACEIVSLDSLTENKGIGNKLIQCVIEKAKEENCKRIWLITINDNTRAIRFYQKRGFDMIALHVNAVRESRIGTEVGKTLGYTYPIDDDAKVTEFLKMIKELPKDTK